jgi:hypothetical protein
MESYVPPILPPERAPDNGPDQPKPRWNVFELFKKAEAAAASPEVGRTHAPEQAPERPALKPERRKFAAKVMELSRVTESSVPAYEAATFEEDAVIAIDRGPRAVQAEVAAMREAPMPETVQFVERAKEMGRGVLRLIGRVTQEVNRADNFEHVTRVTDLEPLAAADADVRAAMEELVAPIEAISTSEATAAPGDAIDAAVQSGGDREFSFLNELKTPFARSLEVAASVASVAAREALEVKEKVLTSTGAIRKVGLFALGAATAGGFAYTWNRIREMKKEQRQLRRERKRFEAEVRDAQAREERRLHELEESNVQGMTQPERQQYVQDVSDFAHARAEEIRTTARMRELVPVPGPQESVPVYSRPETPQSERPAIPTEKLGTMERIGAGLGAAKESASAAVGSAVAAGMSLLHGRHPHGNAPQQKEASQKSVHQAQPSAASQAWLWGTMLAIGVVIFIFLWSLRIL